MRDHEPLTPRSHWTQGLVIHAMFALTGAVTTLLGPMLPAFVAWWDLDDARAGLLFTMQFAGSTIGAALSGFLIRRLGFRSTLILGLALMAAGVGTTGVAVGWLGHAAVACYGFGLGFAIPATNLFVAERARERRAAALSLLNLSWGVGAVLAPPTVAVLQARVDARAFLFGLAAALLLAVAAVDATVPRADSQQRPADEPPPAERLTSKVARFGAFLFLYVGSETSVGGWASVYATRIAMPAGIAVAVPSLFWGSLLFGRALAPVVLQRISEQALLTASLVLTTIAVAGLSVASSPAVFAVIVALAGLGMSAVFPVSLALFTRELNVKSPAAAGPVFVLAALGGATLPWLVGVLSDGTGSLAAGLIVPGFGCLAMLALSSFLLHSRSF